MIKIEVPQYSQTLYACYEHKSLKRLHKKYFSDSGIVLDEDNLDSFGLTLMNKTWGLPNIIYINMARPQGGALYGVAGTVAHECYHYVNYICNSIGHNPMYDDEAMAYLIGYISRMIMKGAMEHIGVECNISEDT